MKKILEETIGILIGAIICIPINYFLFFHSWETPIIMSISLTIAYFISLVIVKKIIPNFKNPFKLIAFWFRYKNSRYYFKTEGTECLEECPIDSTVKIGSIYCQNCKYCIDKNANNGDCIWITCKHLIKKRSFNIFKKINKN